MNAVTNEKAASTTLAAPTDSIEALYNLDSDCTTGTSFCQDLYEVDPCSGWDRLSWCQCELMAGRPGPMLELENELADDFPQWLQPDLEKAQHMRYAMFAAT